MFQKRKAAGLIAATLACRHTLMRSVKTVPGGIAPLPRRAGRRSKYNA